ncbi:hypothetical protein [Comamonas sp. NoAH]|uniref:hypothetical protein n=1 Tax=Comamonas halotolerans TaxID=3041496 RepID=UPI0024E166D9|nr:hypothetical protein [Comamonas sp. NoAH]
MLTPIPIRFYIASAAAVSVMALLSACQDEGPILRADTFPMGQADRFDQPAPKKPLLGSDSYLRSQDVLPVAKADIREPLPAGVPLPDPVANLEVIQPQASTAEPSEEQGGVTPAAGMAAVITNAQGDGETNKLDGGTVK